MGVAFEGVTQDESHFFRRVEIKDPFMMRNRILQVLLGNLEFMQKLETKCKMKKLLKT